MYDQDGACYDESRSSLEVTSRDLLGCSFVICSGLVYISWPKYPNGSRASYPAELAFYHSLADICYGWSDFRQGSIVAPANGCHDRALSAVSRGLLQELFRACNPHVQLPKIIEAFESY